MALIVKDRVLETCSTSGLVDFTLTGAVTGYQRFSAIGNGNTTYYAAYVIGSNDWEVGIGTVGTSSLTRDTIFSSSTGSKVNFAGNPVVWCDLPSSKALFTDSNNNATANSFLGGFTSVTASGTQIVLTAASTPDYVVTGSGGQTIKLPDATTLANGTTFDFNNNQSSGAITVNNNSNTLVASIPSGGYVSIVLLSNATATGSWDRHDQAPSNVSWSTNTFDYAGSITSATWNGSTVAVNRGGTGATTLTGYVKGSGTSALTASSTIPTSDLTGTLPVANGGTGQTTFTANQVLYGNGTSGLSTSTGLTFSGTVLGATSLALNSNANLFGEAANALALRNGTSGQSYRVYNTYTDASNYERFRVTWVSNLCVIGNEAAGTGANRQIAIVGSRINFGQSTAGYQWYFDTDNTGNFLPVVDNGFDIGKTTQRVKTIYLSNGIAQAGVSSTTAAAPTIASAATIAPTTSIVFISGTTTINTITPPTSFTAGGGQITLIPTGLFSTGVSGNIALATVSVVSKALIMTYDATTAKWYPSY